MAENDNSGGPLARLWGFLLRRPAAPAAERLPSFAPPSDESGALQFTGSAGWTGYSTYLDLENAAKTEADMITRYRQLAAQPEVQAAVDEIVNESIVDDEEEDLINIDLGEIEELAENEKLQDVIQEEFKKILSLLKFEEAGYSIFQRWYVDGRLYYHLVVDKQKLAEGIQEIRYIDPRKIRKIREIIKTPGDAKSPGDTFRQMSEYFLYNDSGFGSQRSVATGGSSPGTTLRGIKIAKDAITYATSGVIDDTGNMMLSNLNPAMRLMNQLRALEDSVVMYRLVRAPERRIWYIDTGNLPRSRAEAYMQEQVNKHRNFLSYDPTTGNINSQVRYISMTQDYFLARGSGDRGTKVETLPAGEITGKIEDVVFFQKKLYKALNVPLSRLQPEDMYVLGRASEISREEVSFSKFVSRLRRRFAQGLFTDILGKQLALKGIVEPDDWDKISAGIVYRFAQSNLYASFKEQEIWTARGQAIQGLTPMIGSMVSVQTIRRKLLNQADEDIEEENKLIAEEREDPQYAMFYQTMQPEQPGFGGADAAEIPEEPLPGAPPAGPKPNGANGAAKPNGSGK